MPACSDLANLAALLATMQISKALDFFLVLYMTMMLFQVVSADVSQGNRVMVFCNTLDSCRATDYFLQERGFDTCCCHGDIPLDGRKEAIRRFSPPEEDPESEENPIMVCTDLAARYGCLFRTKRFRVSVTATHLKVQFDWPSSAILGLPHGVSLFPSTEGIS